MNLGNSSFANKMDHREKGFLSLYHIVLLLILIPIAISCSQEPEAANGSESPSQVQGIKDLTMITPIDDHSRIDTVKLIEDTVFESNSDVFMEGYIRNIAVDDKEQLFISSTRPGFVGIYVLNPDGSFLTKFSQEGRGPGEYESLSSLNIVGEKLYVFDTRLQKIGIFSIDGLKHTRDLLIDQSLLKENEGDKFERMVANKLMVRNDGSFIVRLKSRPRNDPSFQHKEIYFQADESGRLLPSPYFEVNSHAYYFPEGQLELPFSAPFTRSSLVSINGNGQFYSNWTENFLIEVHSPDAEQKDVFFAPFENAGLNINEMNFDRNMKRTLDKYELPDTWPALHTMELDDEDNLWVATITDSETEFTWYVLNSDGNLIARFMKPGRRSVRAVIRKPMIVIKNGYFYEHERDFRQGIDRIVKYKIEFREAG